MVWNQFCAPIYELNSLIERLDPKLFNPLPMYNKLMQLTASVDWSYQMPLMALIENSFDLVVAGDDPVGVGEAAGLDQDLALVGSDVAGGVSRESAGLGGAEPWEPEWRARFDDVRGGRGGSRGGIGGPGWFDSPIGGKNISLASVFGHGFGFGGMAGPAWWIAKPKN